jgi:hypothetical protein
VHGPISGCCQGDGDCADSNPCTEALCVLPQGVCAVTQIESCCSVDTDCVDHDPCTLDRCDTASNSCITQTIPGCTSDAGSSPSADGGPSYTPRRFTRSGALIGGCSMGGQWPGAPALGFITVLVLWVWRRSVERIRRG